jgi:hypothetical protein
MNKVEYRIKGYHAFSELDTWQNGCTGKVLTEFNPEFFQASNTVKSLVDLLCIEFLTSDFELDACEENGRIDLQCWQLKPFDVRKVSDTHLTKWKIGKLDLYLTTYSFHVEKVLTNVSLNSEL